MQPTSLLRALVLMAISLCAAAEEKTTAAQEPPTGIKVGVITNAGGAHLDAYFSGLAHAPEATTVVLADEHGQATALARKALGEKLTAVHEGMERMLAEEKPDMALISLEARLAPVAIRAALEAGCHVLAEKPACVNAADFEALVALAESKNLNLMLALTNRLHPEFQKAKALVDEGALGRIYNVQVTMVKDQTRLTSKGHQDSWFSDKTRSGGGQLAWLGIHWLDLAMFVSGSPVTEVAGFAANVGGQPVNIEDSAALALRFENGATGTMTSGYYLDTGLQTLLKIWGSKGWLELSTDTPRTVRWYSTASGEPRTDTYTPDGGHSSYGYFVRACVRASAGLEAPPITGRECLNVLETIFGLYEAAEKGATVTLN